MEEAICLVFRLACRAALLRVRKECPVTETCPLAQCPLNSHDVAIKQSL